MHALYQALKRRNIGVNDDDEAAVDVYSLAQPSTKPTVCSTKIILDIYGRWCYFPSMRFQIIQTRLHLHVRRVR